MKLPSRWSLFPSPWSLKIGALCLVLGFFVFLWTNHQGLITVFAEESIEALQKQITDLQHLKELSEAATTPLEKELSTIKTKVASIKKELAAADAETQHLAGSIEARGVQLDAQYRYLAARVRSYYKMSRQFSPLVIFLSAPSASGFTKQLTYRTTAVDQDKAIIVKTTQDLLSLEADKKALEQRKAKLQSLRVQFESSASFFDTEISKAKDYQTQLAGKIADLSRRQQEILSAKTGTFQTTVGDVPLADDPASRPDYSPGFSPAFAAFSFGAPHYNGLSQYGAYGRSKANQSVETILRAYYGDIEIKTDYDQNAQICVGSSKSNCTNVPLETYAKRIYEMPGSWGDNGGMNALKAQAVAARSYALADMARNGFICPTESCQVYKPENKGGNWESAVNATPGWVMMKNGKPLWAKYASTAGGYIESYTDKNSGHTTPSFWDTTSSPEKWADGAWEVKGGSPWFYKAWYKDRGGDACGESNPWLTSEEMADILNAWVVMFEGKGDAGRVTPESSCWGGNPYSKGELSGIGGYTSVSGVSVTYSNSGVTASVTLQTNAGPKTISGKDFKKAFNLRAPGKISIKSGLYNIEKK